MGRPLFSGVPELYFFLEFALWSAGYYLAPVNSDESAGYVGKRILVDPCPISVGVAIAEYLPFILAGSRALLPSPVCGLE
jgi:hypothetical protein